MVRIPLSALALILSLSTVSGKIMRRILRKIAEDDFGSLGDTSTLADPSVVDDLIGQEEVVIKPLGTMLHGTPGLAGATITGDGRIALILDIPGLLSHYTGRG